MLHAAPQPDAGARSREQDNKSVKDMERNGPGCLDDGIWALERCV